MPTFRNGFYAGLLVAVIIGLYLAALWRPERQVRLHSKHLLSKVEKKDWRAAGVFIAEDYKDRWEQDRALALERTREVFRFIRDARIEFSTPEVRAEHGEGTWTAKITIAGGAGEYAAVIRERVNSLPAPFELHWRRKSGKPWDWKLVHVENPALEISR